MRTFGALIWTMAILVACWTPGRWLPVPEPGTSGQEVPHKDKLVHFGMFAGFGLLWWRPGAGRRQALGILAGGLVLAVLSEAGQAVPAIHRDPDRLDVLADAVGLVAGLG